MRKLLSNGLVMLAGVVSVPSTVTNRLVPASPIVVDVEDPRLEKLESFFEAKEAPASGVANIFLEAADAYGLDWRLLPSISLVESEGGKTARNNNLFGWNMGKAEFPSLAAAIHAVGYFLSHSNLYKDKSLDEKLETYNPNCEYGRKVKSVMEKIAPSANLVPRKPS